MFKHTSWKIRTPWKVIYSDGTTEEFNPFFLWRFGDGMAVVYTRHLWGAGIYWEWTIGTFSRIKTKFFNIGRLTLFIYHGSTDAYNPRLNKKINKGR